MTIICAQKTTTGVLLGADNSSSDGNKLLRRSTPKLCQVSPNIAFGTSGHVRLFDMLRDSVAKASFPMKMACDSIDDVEAELGRFFRAFLKDEFRANEKGKLWTLIAVDDQIFDVGMDGAIVRIDGRFMATGSAEHIALGALYIFDRARADLPNEEAAKERIQMAMEACAEFGECIRSPWSFASTTK